MDSYVELQRLNVVIDNYTSTYHEREEAIERSVEIKATTYEYAQDLSLPSWQYLPEHLKQVFRLAACGQQENAVALTLNLGPAVAQRAVIAARGEADYLARKIQKVLRRFGIDSPLAFLLEDVDRKGRNVGLHIHGVLCIPEHFKVQVLQALKKDLAKGYIEVASNKAVLVKQVSTTGGWAKYCAKFYRRTVDESVRRKFATQSASAAGQALYEKIIQWLCSLPAPDVLDQERPAPPESFSDRDRRVIELVEHYKAQKAQWKLWLRRRDSDYRSWARQNKEAAQQEVLRILSRAHSIPCNQLVS